MSTNKTQNYQLHAWGLADELPLEEVNENFAKIDEVVAGIQVAIPDIVTGGYTGSTEYNDYETVQKIQLGFQPKAVIVTRRDGFFNGTSQAYGGIIGRGLPAYDTADVTKWSGRITADGFEVRNGCNNYLLNTNTRDYQYMAIK